jgi:hypothetical protein
MKRLILLGTLFAAFNSMVLPTAAQSNRSAESWRLSDRVKNNRGQAAMSNGKQDSIHRLIIQTLRNSSA